jgi:NAD-dependent dihydropyrimidine dehydrogenase PreA subunit
MKSTTRRDAFAKVALWQLMAFVLLLCFLWASELIDLPAVVFDASPTPFNLFRVCLLSAAIITAGIVTVGHAYEQQKAVIKQMLMTCLYCHRIKTAEGIWEHVEEYFIKNYPIVIDRDACPDCKSMLDSIDTRASLAAEAEKSKKEDGISES